jgi:branched-chain amino acid transport system ATP-binding protein
VRLTVTDLDAWYGQAQALFGVDLSVDDGEIVGVFGHNGAGKSTLLRVITGLHRQAKGTITFGDAHLERAKPNDIAAQGLSFVREGARTFEGLTVEEHLVLAQRLARRAGRPGRKRDEIFALFPMLSSRREQKAGYLSGGQRQALALASAFATEPVCLLLDEPSTGLAPIVAEEVYKIILDLSQHQVSLLIAEQNPRWLSDICSRGYLLDSGHVRAEGSPSAFLSASKA